MPRIERSQIPSTVQSVYASEPIVDMHTHLYPPSFGTPVANRSGKTDPSGLMLWGLDELVTYHYLIAEVFRAVPATKFPYEHFWKMTRAEQADHIWKHLFLERTPISEACRGVVTTISKLGLDPGVKSLAQHRKWFAEQDANEYIDKVMEIAGVTSITMTNAVFDDNERARWEKGIPDDPRFTGVLRFDPLLLDWPNAAKKLAAWGYGVTPELNEKTLAEVRRFLHEWCAKVKAIYCAVSLPPEFRYPSGQASDTILAKCVLPVCAERNIPFAMMIGIPLLRQKFGADPAVGGSVMITALTDSGGFFIFLGLATIFLM